MAFLTILLVLFIERALWNAAPYREHRWFSDYAAWTSARFSGAKSGWTVALIILPPLLLIGWLQTSVLPAAGQLFEMTFAGLMLLLSLGPRDLGRDVEQYIETRDRGRRADSVSLAEQFDPGHPVQDPDQSVVRGILTGACGRLIGPLFWFAVFGAAGAAAYRLAHLLNTQGQVESNDHRLARAAAGLTYVLDWVPMRITAAGYAVAGNFDAVAAAWKQCSQADGDAECPNDSDLVVATGYAALEQAGSRPAAVLIEDSLALVWRNLTLWVVFAGAVTLFASL